MGYLVTMHQKRLGVHAAYEHQLRQLYGDDVFTETVPLAKDFKEAVAARTPLSHYKGRCAAAKVMHAICLEMDARAERLRAEEPKFLYLGNRAGVGPEAAELRRAS
jgi:cellulose biosynthesis protein BcsQ